MKRLLAACAALALVSSVVSAAASTAAAVPSTPSGSGGEALLDLTPVTWSAPDGAPLPTASDVDAATRRWLAAHGHDAATMASLRATRTVVGLGGVTHRTYEQQVGGLPVAGSYLKVAVSSDGAVVQAVDALVHPVPLSGTPVAAGDALTAVMARVHPGASFDASPIQNVGGTARFPAGSFFVRQPTATAVALPMADGTLQRGWSVQTWTDRGNQLHQTLVSATGEVVDDQNLTAADTYSIFDVDPDTTPQSVVHGPTPAVGAPSRLGWLGATRQSTWHIVGNNVDAYTDTDGNGIADDGGAPVDNGSFLTPADLFSSPFTDTNKAVSVQNLFVLTNRMHDLLYQYGFTEAAGNFQSDNFGLGGAGGDPVLAQTLDATQTDNSRMATPADGSSPRMTMFTWTPVVQYAVSVTAPTSARYPAWGSDFGVDPTTAGVGGDVVDTGSTGCGPLTGVDGRIALVDRGVCNFGVKAQNALAAGATALVVANNDTTHPDAALVMTSSVGPVAIPAVMVSYNSGVALKALSAPTGTVLRTVTVDRRDAALDSDIVYHEYCHGLTSRMIGNMGANTLSLAIGEGMSDGCALLMNSNDVVGEYSSGDPAGIRRYPYTDYPLTYADVTGTDFHSDGEVYAAIVWLLKSSFGPSRLPTLWRYLVDGMNYTASPPTFEGMRDGILSSISRSKGGAADTCTVWTAFAHYGVGVGAKASVNKRTGAVSIVASTDLPKKCR